MRMKCSLTKGRSFCGTLRAAFLLSSFLLLSPLSVFALEDAPQQQESEQTLEALGSLVHTSLADLKNRSKALTEALRTQSEEVDRLRTTLNELNSCLENTNERLYDYETKLIKSEEKNRQLAKTRNRLILILSLMIGLFVAVRAVTIALRFKGVKLPEIVNILL